MCDAICNASACGTYNYDGAGVPFGKRVRDSGAGLIACAGICRAVASAATGGPLVGDARCAERRWHQQQHPAAVLIGPIVG